MRFQDLFRIEPALREAVSRHLPQLELILVDLATVDESDLRSWTLTDLALVSLWLLRTARHNENLASDLERWLEVLTRIAAAPNGVAAAITLLSYATNVGEIEPDDVLRIAKQLGPTVQETYMTGAERLIERGREEGREEGRRRERLDLVLKLLTQRFGELPPGVEARLQAATFERLGTIAEKLLIASRLDEVIDGF